MKQEYKVNDDFVNVLPETFKEKLEHRFKTHLLKQTYDLYFT